MRFLVLVISIAVLFSSGVPSFAASKKELEAKVIQLEQRLGALENRMLTGDPAAERLMQRMDAMEASQRSLTGEIERLQYERDALQVEVRSLAGQITDLQTLAEDVKRHLNAVEMIAQEKNTQQSGQAGPIEYGSGGYVSGENSTGEFNSGASGIYSSGSAFPPPPTVIDQNGQEVQNNEAQNNVRSPLASIGLSKLDEGDFVGAQTAFLQYLDLEPNAPDRGDVYFWLAETYYAKSGFSAAADAYIASMRTAPKGDYAPEAMVKLAATARALGQRDMACQTLASFPAQYPNAVPAVHEKARIETLRSGC